MADELLITNIKGLVQVREKPVSFLAGKEMAGLPVLSDAYLKISNGMIADYGPMKELPVSLAVETMDATGCFVFPGFVDSHTHLVFAATREDEFVMKIKGATYAEIAAKGGGILNSAKKLQQASEDELVEKTLARANEIIRLGTAAVEIKSGYGLTVKDELKMLRVAKRIGHETPLAVKTTFLGAHAVPTEMKKTDYIKLVIEEMIPAVAEEKLADYIDVFCEEGFFSRDETERIVEEGKKFGMKPRIHANQLHRSGGVQAGVKTNALSVDHLENIGEEEIELLKTCSVMPTALPGAAFFLNLPFPPARKMIDEGLPLAIASDYNPGSSPTGNMQLMISLACIKMKMTPEEAINAATINTAYALELSDTLGSITRGKVASVFISRPAPSVAYLPYHFGNQFVEHAILHGQVIF
ncbi:MAG: Imidazolonepropionase [Cytophagales bacterium]|jgi:imidazolonepropionase|nr:imidazolonepropionase [Bacteroidota bacterium]MBS1980789.1 imidazolonepropionase [Bacteroidota bacterium]WHZ08138.1 MAG: Imidazolonepropionase [Cytophagales bacterium]